MSRHSQILFLLLTCHCAAAVAELTGKPVVLTQNERRWLQNNPVAVVGGIADWAPFDFVDSDGKYAGIANDYLGLITQKTGLRFDVRIGGWSDQLRRLKDKQIDLLGAAYYTEERAEFAIYSKPYFETFDQFFIRDGLQVDTFADLNGKRVAIPIGYGQIDVLRQDFPKIEIVEVASFDLAVKAVLEGRAELLFDSHAALTYALKKQNISTIVPFKSTSPTETLPLHVITRDDQPELASIVQKGLDAITEHEKVEIHDRWLGAATGKQTTTLKLTEEERQWLRDHSTIRLRVDSDWPPYEFVDDKGKPQGLSIDVLRIIERQLGIQFETVEYSWTEALAKAKSRDVDMISNIAKNLTREEYLLFSDVYIAPKYAVFARKDSAPIGSMVDLNKRTVVIEDQFYLHGVLKSDYPEIKLLVVHTTTDALRLLSFGQADAYIGNQGTANWIAEKYVLTNLKIAHVPPELGDSELRFAVRRDWPVLLQLLNKALASIPDVEMQQIRRKWLGVTAEPSGPVLSAQERRWLAEHPTVRFTGDPNWLPYEAFTAEGEYIGIVSEILDRITTTTGLVFERIPSGTWANALDMVARGKVDVISGDLADELIQRTHQFSAPYLERPLSVVMRGGDRPLITSLYEIAGNKIAVVGGYGYTWELFNKYPDLEFIEVDNVQEGLSGVNEGRLDAFVATGLLNRYHINNMGLKELHVVGQIPIVMRVGLAARKKWPELRSIINKAISSIPERERYALVQRWMRRNYEVVTDYRRITFVVLIAAAVLLLSLLWNYSIRRQKERLRLSEERYQSAMEAVSDAVLEWDLVTGERHFSSGFFTRLGYAVEEIPRNNQQWLELIHPADLDHFDTAVKRHIASKESGETPLRLEFRVRAKTGEYICVESRGRVVEWDDKGNALLRRGTLRDVTAQHQALTALQESEKRLQTLNKRFSLAADAISLGVWEYVLDGSERMMLDDRLCRLYGFENTRSIPLQTWLDRIHPDDRHVFRELTEKLRRDGGDASVDFRAYRADGSLRNIYSGFTLIKGEDREPDQIIGVNWDITDRKRAEEQFEKVLNALPASVAISNQEGKILFANQRAQREFGGGVSLVGMRTEDFYTDKNKRAEILAEVRQHGQIMGMEHQYRTRSGDTVEGLLSAIPITFDAQPALLGIVVNITERRNMEKALAAAKEQAEQASRFKSEFLANMSHEIRTPMNAIVGLGQLLARTPLNTKQTDYVYKVQRSAQSLLGIIDDILDFSKIEAGQLRIESTEFSLDEVLINLTMLANTRIEDKPVEFIYRIDSEVPARLRGDPHRLGQILTNLVSNAIKFTERGHILLSVTRERQDAPVQLNFAVEDTGIGVPPEKVDALFAPFIQADGSTTRRYGGTGLGLSICRQLTELMGGTISATSEPGKGSRFQCSLPFEVAEQLGLPRTAPDLRGMRVLLIDDNRTVLEVLSDMLVSLSFRVDVASSGEEALAKLRKADERFDLVLVDWHMPQMNGGEVARRIRAQFGSLHMPTVILMTTYGRDAMAQAINQDELDGVLVKPVTPSQLLDVIVAAKGARAPNVVSSNQVGSEAPGVRPLSGLILLAEDNLINQQVARELLEQMGLAVEICANGVDAVASVKRKKPDLILMDIQMPDMDGYQATHLIRQIDGTESLPIIAMTANAMVGDAERSLQAGMNGHVTKPVDPAELYKTLKVWLHTAEGRGAADTQDLASQLDATLDWNAELPGIDLHQGLTRVGGNRPLYAKLLRDLLTNYIDAPRLLRQYLADDNDEAAQRLTHTLRGVAGTIGANNLETATGSIDDSLREGASVNDGQMEAFGGAWEELVGSLTRWLPSSSQSR